MFSILVFYLLVLQKKKCIISACALNQSIQQYQRELASIRIWNQELEEQLATDVPPVIKEQQQKLREEAKLTESQLCHFLLVYFLKIFLKKNGLWYLYFLN